MGMVDTSQYDPRTYQPGANLLALLLGNGGQQPVLPPGDPNASWSTPTDMSAVNRNGTSGVTLPQTSASSFGRDPGPSNPFASLFGGIGDAVGGLFNGGGQQAAPPQMGAPQAPQSPGIGDHLSAGFQGLTRGGLTSAIGGLFTGQRQDPEGLLEAALIKNGNSPDMAHAAVRNPQYASMLLGVRQQAATQEALIRAGVPPALAQAASLNPEILKTIAPQLYSKPEFKTVKNALGEDIPIFANADKQTITYPQAVSGGQSANGAQPNSPGVMQQVFDQIEQGRNSGAPIDQLLQTVPNSLREGVRSMLSGGVIPSNLSNRGAARDLTLRFAHAIDPSFDESLIPARVALQKSYQGGGKNYQETLALNTVGGHLSRLMDAADGLGNTGFRPWNWIKNQATDATVGNPALVKFRNDLVTTQNELAKAYHGGHVSDSAYNAFSKAIGEAQTPAELRTAIGELAGLLASKITANETGYRSGMNGLPLPAQYRAINDEAKHSFDKIDKWVGGQGAQQQTPAAIPRAALEAEARRRGLMK